MALYAQAPKSYTGEDTLELHVHGSPAVARETLRALLACGARYAQPGEFTRRAFLNGKMDLHAADSVADLIEAESRSAARAALANLGGGLTAEIQKVRRQLAALLEELAASLDFPDEVPEPDPARIYGAVAHAGDALRRLQRDGEVGRLVREGVGVAIVGPPNSGKSSLLNALLGDERALVSELAGTTRDTIEESIAVQGVLVRLIDTAGIRAHADRIEAQGIVRTERALESARILLLVFDGSEPLGADALTLLDRTAGRARIVFCNKADLGDAGARLLDPRDIVHGSVRNGATIEALRSAIARVGWGGDAPDLERPHLVTLREFETVGTALRALSEARRTIGAGEPADLIVPPLQEAFAALAGLAGGPAGEALLDGIFARFCIGK